MSGSVLLQFHNDSTGKWILDQNIKFESWEKLDGQIENLLGASLGDVKELNDTFNKYYIQGLRIDAIVSYDPHIGCFEEIDKEYVWSYI